MHPFVLPLVVMLALDVAIVAGAAAIRTTVCPHRPLAFHTLAVWAVVILCANLGNELRAVPLAILAVVAAGVAALVLLGRRRADEVAPQHAGHQWRDALTVLAALVLPIGLLLVPLRVLPDRTLIAGYQICNDAVTHAIMMRGFETLSSEYGHWYWLGYYPAGFHSLVYALGPLFRSSDVPTYLLPACMWAASFVALAILMLLDDERYRSRIGSVLVAASPAAAFLVVTSVYLDFVGHVSVLPFLIGGVVIASSWTAADLRGRGVVLALAPAAAAAAAYGLVAVTAIGFALALRLAWQLRDARRLPALVREALRSYRDPSVLVALALLASAFMPVAWRIAEGYTFFLSETASFGNLPAGFLSPFHVTGLWTHFEYRSQMAGSPVTMVLAAVLVGQVWLVATANLGRTSIISLLTLGTPVVVSAMAIRSPYVNFKYLCLFTALWLPLVMLALARATLRLAGGLRAAPVAALVATLLVLVISPLQSFRQLPALPEHWFRAMALIRDQHFRQGRVLVLSKEDWFHYYRDADDIVVPTYMFPQTYTGEAVREVVVDDVLGREATALLAKYMPGSDARLTSCAPETIGGRFRVYQASCLIGATR